MQGTVTGIYIGQPQSIGPQNAPTGIYKEPVESAILTPLGLEGDHQMDRRVHGGPEKALYHYPADNYAILQQAFGHLADRFIPGSIGENISSTGMTDKDVHIGDIFTIGETRVQVSQPRRPCWKVNHKFGNGHMAPVLMSQAISGWYYRVIEAGTIQLGDEIKLEERLENSVAVAEIWSTFLQKLKSRMPPEAFNTNIPGLSDEWRFE